jgi:hypothetical protein
MGQEPEPRDRAMDTVLAEYNALRTEITSTIGSQQTLVGLNITAAATVAGLVVAEKADPKLFLVAAALSSVLGLVYVASALHIESIGSYITNVLRPVAVEYTGDVRLLGWVKHFRVYHRKTSLIYRSLTMGVVFFGVPIIALVWAPPHLDNWNWVAWALTVGLLVVQFGAWTLFGVRSLRRPDPQNPGPRAG